MAILLRLERERSDSARLAHHVDAKRQSAAGYIGWRGKSLLVAHSLLLAALIYCLPITSAQARPHHRHSHTGAAAAVNTQSDSTTQNGGGETQASGSGTVSEVSEPGLYATIALALVGGAATLYLSNRTKRLTGKRKAELDRRYSEGQAKLDAFQATHLIPIYPHIFRTQLDTLLCMDVAGSELRLISAKTTSGELMIISDFIIDTRTIASVELITHERKWTESTTVTKKKRAIGRAVVGELIAGPTGALVGAISAGSTSKTVGVEQAAYEYSELVIGLTDPDNPVVRFRNIDRALSDQWLHRIRGTVATNGASLRARSTTSLAPTQQSALSFAGSQSPEA